MHFDDKINAQLVDKLIITGIIKNMKKLVIHKVYNVDTYINMSLIWLLFSPQLASPSRHWFNSHIWEAVRNESTEAGELDCRVSRNSLLAVVFELRSSKALVAMNFTFTLLLVSNRPIKFLFLFKICSKMLFWWANTGRSLECAIGGRRQTLRWITFQAVLILSSWRSLTLQVCDP